MTPPLDVRLRQVDTRHLKAARTATFAARDATTIRRARLEINYAIACLEEALRWLDDPEAEA